MQEDKPEEGKSCLMYDVRFARYRILTQCKMRSMLDLTEIDFDQM